MERVQDIQVGDSVVVQVPPDLTTTSSGAPKNVRGVIESIEGDDVTVRIADVAELADDDSPVITCRRDEVVPAAVAEVP